MFRLIHHRTSSSISITMGFLWRRQNYTNNQNNSWCMSYISPTGYGNCRPRTSNSIVIKQNSSFTFDEIQYKLISEYRSYRMIAHEEAHGKARGKRHTVCLCVPTVLMCSSAVPIGGSRLFRLRGIGEGEERQLATTGLQIPPVSTRMRKHKVRTIQEN